MTPRGRKYMFRSLAIVIAAVALGGCISPIPTASGRYTAPIGGSPVISNETPYSAALRCLSRYTVNKPLRIAVGQIADYTGKTESDNSGRKITQGAALMAMSALAKAGVPLVERFDTSVAEMELKYANNKLIGADGSNGPGDYRKIMAGSIPGSDYYLVGGITELNFNIRSEGANADGGGIATNAVKGTIGGSMYVMNVGLDLRLVDTTTLQVVDVISYQKQIIGRQISAGVFDFLGQTFFDASVGESALEPIQLAVRSVIERAVLEMMSRLYHAPQSACTSNLGTANDPVTDVGDRRPMPEPAYAQPAATAMNEEKYNDTSRQDPYRYYSDSDASADAGLRGQLQ
ncbi:MAG: holdfast anchoring protein HfaB [Alphaproteobacteria bacterium]|nr:holdfast anchoring protein HfaB [Alphaproteobacteria bacterium]MDE1986559.1 holdfast anchoring protein HfaB [Alphaproteobacteria bacterium]MDE2164171.1 holdfast anchoring protein HfaB [Alphaproteobacteria bacterium]MDE2500253.1 holdfast anchoring protein HfaB [Alphaproteobacteria bacterium]